MKLGIILDFGKHFQLLTVSGYDFVHNKCEHG